MTTTQTDRIRALNDDLRQHLIGGGAVSPLASPPFREAIDRIVKTIAVYDGFCHANGQSAMIVSYSLWAVFSRLKGT